MSEAVAPAPAADAPALQQEQQEQEEAVTAASSSKALGQYVMRIHNVWYDMSGYKHPGGPVMLSLGGGRDATALFEAHHPFTARSRLEAVLSKHRIPEDVAATLRPMDEKDLGDSFVWPEQEAKDGSSVHETAPISDFARELTQKVGEYFRSEAERRGVPLLQASKATPLRWLELTIMTAMFLATLPATFRGEYWALVAMPLTYWIWGVNVMHDATHFGLSRDWRINAGAAYIGWYFCSPLEWYHQHVIGHHAYPNIPFKDPDLYHNARMERHTTTLRWRPAHAHQNRTWLPIWVIGTFAMSFVKPLQMIVSGYYNRCVMMIRMSKTRFAIHVAGRFFTFFMLYCLPFLLMDTFRAVLFAVVPVSIISVCFMAASQVNHLTPPNIDVASDDYYKHQVLTSHTFSATSRIAFWLTGGLNMQTEHHLFPAVNHCHLSALQPIVKSICQKYNVPYHESTSFAQAFGKYLQHLKEMSFKPKTN